MSTNKYVKILSQVRQDNDFDYWDRMAYHYWPDSFPSRLETRVVVFLDFLGVSAAAHSWPHWKNLEFLTLLMLISKMARELSSSVSSLVLDDDGNIMNDARGYIIRSEVIPEVSSFSDCVIISYELEYSIERILDDAFQMISALAGMALMRGVLVRGGIAFGECYHNFGAVFGKGLIEAYHLESKEAIYPRFLVSEGLVSHLIDSSVDALSREFFTKEGDFYEFDYINLMVKEAFRDIPADSLEVWKTRMFGYIENGLEEASKAEHLPERRVEKWMWFKTRFETAVRALP
ncbi:MAG: hypothetical protein ABSC06_38180 [Rhodopila sp.]|jgi:hypothetical protein